MRFLFVAMNNSGELTGGDTIWMKLAFAWDVKMMWNVYARSLLPGYRINPIKPTIWNITRHTLYYLYVGLFRFNMEEEFDYVYSVSDFYPDLLPALKYKFLHRNCKWIAGYYLIAPHPFHKNSPYKGILYFKGFLYWLMQRVSLSLVRGWADVVYVTSEPDKKYFPNKKVVVIRGGVDMEGTYNAKDDEKVYDAVFVGRFHYQKGVMELVDIWKGVCETIPKARLAMIGDGPLYQDVKKKIVSMGLQDNIELLGFMTGEQKHKVFRESRLFLHPATFDSGGMACAEGMAWGLPAVGFDLEAFKTYYPQGMVKVRTIPEFADKVIFMLHNQDIYDKYSQEARQLIENEWDWNKQEKRIYNETV